MKNIISKIWNKTLGFVYSIFKPVAKYSTTVSDDLIVKEIPSKEPIVIEAFYHLAVEPKNIFELLEEKEGKMTLMQLSTGKTITIRKDLFSLNFRPVRSLDNSALDKIINKSKINYT